MKVELHDRIADVDPARWDASGKDVFSNYAMLKALEEAHLPGVRMRYATLANASGDIVAAAPITRIDVDAEHLTHGAFRLLIRAVRKGYDRFLRTRLIVCGTPLSVGSPPVRNRNGVDRGLVLKQLAGILHELGDVEQAPWRVFKEFDAPQLPTAAHVLGNSGLKWLMAPSEPNASIPIYWTSFAEYLACLRSHYRYKIRTAARKMTKAGVTVQVTGLSDAYDDSLHDMYDAVLSRAAVQFERLTPQFFRCVGRAFGDAVRLLVFHRDRRAIGWVVLLFDGDTVYDLFHGIDYSENEETALYFNQLAEVLKLAIQCGARRLSLGQSTEIAKARFGARPVPLWIGLRHRSRTVTATLRRGQRVFFPEKSLPQRRVFRECRTQVPRS
ncbi:MAG: GNAT family N-acetyltransferase [Gemmatimonadota bacterium]|nr:MAG: GNAT family N-acetyltransferase [Gemmatimonadota bacterium]